MEDSERVDLDLSVALYNKAWTHVGTSDYTSLRVAGAVHSGDLTSAPAPLGASEFIDLDADRLARAGARYAVMSILSFNNVAFTDMAEAFAGFMLRTAAPTSGEVFEARAVEQKFDLTGPGKVTIPFVVDLEDRTMRWLDVNAKVTGTNHAIHRHHDTIALLGEALTDAFRAGSRVTLGELARWQAAARTDEILVRAGDAMIRFRRRPAETLRAFADRLTTDDGEGIAGPADAAKAGLLLLERGDLPTREGAQVYALHPASLNASSVQLLAAADVAAMLAPARDG